jgi:hypothetical protein
MPGDRRRGARSVLFTAVVLVAVVVVAMGALALTARQRATVAEPPSIDVSTPGAKTYARSLLVYPRKNFRCLELLWQKESGWNARADNPGSTAYGIPQSLPGNKMAVEGADWRRNYRTQVRWGVKYIWRTYRNPCRAWRHAQIHNWY